MASDAPLIDSYFKTERAKVHLEELRIAVQKFVKDNTHSVSVKSDAERKVTLYHVTFDQPHVGLYLIAGDVFQCLRTALDQAVWWFASQTHTDPDWTQFPIFETDNSQSRKRFDTYTRGVPQKAVDYIKALQPYNRPQRVPLTSHYLWILHELNRIDKHRRISVWDAGAEIKSSPSATISALDDGYEVANPFDAKPAFQPSFSPHVVFGDGKIVLPFDHIERIYGFVRNVVLPGLAGCV